MTTGTVGLWALGLWYGGTVQADTVHVAVAANFTTALQALAAAFEQETGHRLTVSSAGTGRLYAQITHGAPFEVFLSADHSTPARLITEGHAVVGTACTYAIGKLVLWSADPQMVDNEGHILHTAPTTQRLAIAQPKVAPYGLAAQQALQHMGLWTRWESACVFGENIAQTHQFVASGAAPLGFVAASQVMKDGRMSNGSGWVVPRDHYSPLRQDAVLLQRGKDQPAAKAFLQWLSGGPARGIIRSFGYEVP